MTAVRVAIKLIGMPLVLLALLFALQLTAAGCLSDDTAAPIPTVDSRQSRAAAGDSAPPIVDSDRDHDGLCDLNEDRRGTNPALPDTDADGFPDTVEVIAGYDPTDPLSPGREQIGYLVSQPDSTLDLELRATVDGNGQGVTGQFADANAFDARGARAGSFFQSAVAVGAVPPDNVRGVQADDERFVSVTGKTRLSFRLHFAYDNSMPRDCAAALPFEYAIKSDVGGYVSTRVYLLVVTPKNPVLKPEEFCRPIACL